MWILFRIAAVQIKSYHQRAPAVKPFKLVLFDSIDSIISDVLSLLSFFGRYFDTVWRQVHVPFWRPSMHRFLEVTASIQNSRGNVVLNPCW